MHILLRVARDALLVCSLFALGGFFGMAFADASGLTGSIGTTLNSWEIFAVGLIGFIVFVLLIMSIIAIPSRGWGPAALVFVVAIGLANITSIRDALL